MFRRFFCLLMTLACLLPFLLPSCSRTETDPETAPEEEPASSILTAVFTETICELPEAARVSNEIVPLYDREAGTITEFLLEREETTDADGVIGEKLTAWLYTIPADGTGEILEKEEIPNPFENSYFHGGAVLPDAVITVNYREPDGFTIYRTDRTTRETVPMGNLSELLGKPNITFGACAADTDGRFYCTDNNTVAVFHPDHTLAFTYDFPAQIYTMARGSDGAVWVTFNAGAESCAARIDPETQKLGTYYSFTRGTDNAGVLLHHLLPAPMNAGESAYDFFYYDRNSAVWGVKAEENGSLTETMVIDLFNSGISKLHLDNTGNTGLYPMALLSDDLFLTWRYDGNGWGGRHDAVVLHRRADPVDMSEMTVITIAYAYPLAASTVEKITEFKRTRPNLSIVLEDYSAYSTTENTRAGEEKLCFDLVNGFIKPDIIITDASVDSLSDNMVITQLTRNNLYIDLKPYLEKDGTLNFDNLFGCIPRLFDDGKGGMWGISADFTIEILYGSALLLGDLTEQESWTLTEMLDFFDSLPPSTEKLYGHSRVSSRPLCVQGYGYFLRDDGCTFDSEEFVRYLNYIKSLPADYTEWRQVSPVADIRKLSMSQWEAAEKAAIAEGRIALDDAGFRYHTLHDVLFSDTIYPIGYATTGDSGVRVRADTTYSITAFAEDPALCFELMKSFFVREVKYVDAFSFYWPFFSRRDHFEETLLDQTTPSEIQLMSDEEYRIYCEELGIPYSRRAEPPTPFTDEERAALYDLLDNIGSPILEETPTAVEEIVEEEMSAFLSGMGTAEDCAKKIQSRVEIWISEHE